MRDSSDDPLGGTANPQGLARDVDAAQSILDTPAAAEARQLELALAAVNRDAVEAMARAQGRPGPVVIDVGGGLAAYAGPGHPLTQGLSMGLRGPVTAAELDRMEAHLRQGGEAGCQLEVNPFVDPSLTSLLAARGYRVHEWQLVWTRHVPAEPLADPMPPGITVRLARPDETALFLRVVMAGFLESEEVPEDVVAAMMPSGDEPRQERYLAFAGETAIGGGSLSWAGEVAFIGGSGVRPAFRRRGAQGALIRVRLDRARALGLRLACSSTLPGTASRRNMERHGFHVAYPKLVMLRGG